MEINKAQPNKLVRISKEAVLNFVKINGPLVPNDVKRKLGSDTMIIGAMLSELTTEKKLRVSFTKVGGSPAYYCPGQEFKLQELSKYLNEKDQQAYELLRSKRILRDTELTPLLRVALRSIKDFAIPVEVNIDNKKEIFWKWYLLPNNVAEEEIKKSISETIKRFKPEPKKIEKEEIIEKPVKEEKEEVKEKEAIKQTTLIKKEREEKPLFEERRKREEVKPEKPIKAEESEFLDEIKKYFSKNNIELLETNIIKKNSEIDFIISIPSTVGNLRYYCKAKSKKKINEGDLSSAYVQGETKKLPVLFLTNGELTKRAEEMLDKEFKNMKIKQTLS